MTHEGDSLADFLPLIQDATEEEKVEHVYIDVLNQQRQEINDAMNYNCEDLGEIL